jgi:hypothetical protein
VLTPSSGWLERKSSTPRVKKLLRVSFWESSAQFAVLSLADATQRAHREDNTVNDSAYRSVCDALSRQLGTDLTELRMHHRLERDLGLSPLDRDMIALWLEEMESVELVPSEVQDARTVGQLVRMLRACKRESEADDRAQRHQKFRRFVGTLPRKRVRPHRYPRRSRLETILHSTQLHGATLCRHA